MKIKKIIHGCSITRNIGNYENIRVHNEIESTVEKGDTYEEVHVELRRMVAELNTEDMRILIKNSNILLNKENVK